MAKAYAQFFRKFAHNLQETDTTQIFDADFSLR